MPSEKSDHSANSGDSFSLAADFFLIFSSSTALMVWDAVRKKKMSASAISKRLGVARPMVLKILQAMERKGFLVSSTKARTTLYGIPDSSIAKALNTILELPERSSKRAGTHRTAHQARRQKSNNSSDTIVSVCQNTTR